MNLKPLPGIKLYIPLIFFFSCLLVNKSIAQKGFSSTNLVSAAALPDGKILVTTSTLNMTYNSASFGRIGRLHSTGLNDQSFSELEPSSVINASISLQGDKILLFGNSSGSTPDMQRLNSDGTLDNSFTSVVTDGGISTATVLPDNRIVISGTFSVVNNVARTRIAILNSNGTLDNSFVPPTTLGNITHHAVQSNGSIILSGDVTGKLARLNTTGTLDNGFTPNFNQNISHFVIDNSNSRILAVGAFNFISSFNIINGIQAANPLTTTNNSINAIVLEPNTNNIFIAGNFTEVGGITGQNRFAKLSSTGALVNSLIFSTGTGFNNSINRPPVILPNKKIILISSTFTSYNNIPVNSIVQLNENGSLDNSFNNALEVTLNNIAFEREYDATTSATPASASSPGLTGLQPGDNGLVSLTGTPTFTYDNKNVGINKAMTITGYRITGGAAFKYYLNPSTVKGKINPKPLTINGLSATTKIYDGNKSAPFPANQTLTLNGVLNNEVTLNTSGPITAEFTDKNVQNNKTVTFLGYKLDNNSLGNYSLPNPTVTNASITAKTVVFSGVSAKNKVYDGNKSAIIETNPAPSLLFTVSGDLVSINLTNAKAEFADANASQNPKTVTFSGFALKDQDAGNYTFAQPSSKTSLITPKPISISSAVIPNNKTYDGNTNGTFSISDSPPKFSGVISGDVVTLDDANAKANFPNKNFGTYTNTVTFTGFALGGNSAGNYSLTSQPPNSTASIGKRPLTINVGISDKPYDGNKSATLTGDQTLNNVVKTANGSEPITLSGSPTFAFPESAIGGPYTITITGYTLSTNDAANAPTTNYALTTPVVSASILKKKLTISNLKADKVYDGSDIATLSGGTLSGFVGGESATLNYSNVIAKFPSKDVNSYTLTNITGLALGGANPNNYFIDQPTNLPAKITAKDLTLTGVAAKNKQYDGTTDAEIITTNIAFSGLVPGEGAPNIDFSTLNAKATFASKNADNSTAKDVTYTGFTISGGLAGNYNFIQPQKTTAFIFPREVSVKDISIEEKEYNGNVSANFINKGSLDNMVVSEAIKYSLNSANAKADFLTKDVGTNKSLVVSGYTLFKSDGDVNFPLSNYVMKQPTNVTGEIKQKPVNVSVTAIPRVYDGTITVALGNATLSGVIPAEMGSIVLDPNAVTIATVLDKNVAPSKAVTVTGFKLVKQGNLPDISTNNYVVVQPQNLTVQISAKPLTVTGISVASKEYNKTDVAQISGSATLSGLVQDDADKKTVTLNTVGAAAKYSSMNAGGPYAVTISGYTIGGVDAPNYDFKQPTVPNASITQKTVTITGITAQDKTYNGNNTATLSGTAALVGVIPGDLSPTPLVEINTNNIPSATFASINTGSHNITVNGYVLKGSAANNYTIQQPFTLQNKAIINKAPVTISGVTSSNKVYDGNKNAAIVGQATYSGVILDDIASDAIDEAVNVTNAKAEFVDANAGPNKDVIFTGFALAGDPTAINNYQVTQPTKVQAQITQKPLTLTGLSAKDKVYNKNKDAEIIKNNLALSGLVSVDVGAGLVDISEVNPKAVFAFAEVGKHTITFSGYGISGSKAPNYAFSPPTNVQASITPKELEMQGISIEPKVYDGNTNAKVLGTASLISSQILSGDQVGLVTITPVASFVDKNANPNPKDVTISTFTLNGNQAANYKLKQPSLTGFINRKELTITNNTANISIGNKEYDGNTNAIIKGSLNQLDGIVGSEKVTLVAQNAKANFDTKNVANNKPITITGFDLGGDDFVNYTLKQPTFLTANITAKPLTVTGIAVTPKVYDRTKTVTFTNKGTLSGLVASDAALVTLNTTNATAEYSDVNVANYMLNVTGYTLNGTATDIANYTFTQPQAFSASITPKPLTLSNLTIQDKTYDGTLTAQISGNAGLVGVISPDDVKLNTATVTANFADANVGTNKDVTVSGLTISGLQVANYSLSVTGGNLKGNINAKPLTITGLSASNKVYDGSNTATLVGGTVTGKVGVDDVSLNTTTATATFPSRNKGTNLAVAVTGVSLNGGAKGNYSIAQPTNLTANITEKPLTVTGIVVTPKVYDKTKTVTFTNKGALSGLVASDAALVTLNTTNATAEYSNFNVGNYSLNVTGYTLNGTATDIANYAFTQPQAFSASITPKPLTLSNLTIQDKTYDGTLTAQISGNAGLVGVISPDDVKLNTATVTANFADANVGTNKDVTVSGLTISGLQVANYSLSVTGGNLKGNINAKPLTITGLNANSKVYDGTNTATLVGGTVTGKVGVDDVSLNTTTATATFPSRNKGTNLDVTVTGVSLNGGAKGNYTVAQPTGLKANITEKPLTVTGIVVTPKVYDKTKTVTFTNKGTLSGLVASDAALVTLITTNATAEYSDVNVANYMLNVTGYTLNGSATDIANYTFTQPQAFSASITPKSLTLSNLSIQEKFYDGTSTAQISGNAGLVGVISPDDVKLNINNVTANFADANVGTNKDVTVSGLTISGLQVANYSLSVTGGNLKGNINAKPLTITGLSANNKVYDGTNTATLVGGTVTGKVGPDDVSLNTTTATATFPSKNKGTNLDVTVTGVSLNGGAKGNYTVTQPTGLKANITEKPLTVTGIVVNPKVYDRTKTVTFTNKGALSGLVASDATLVTLNTTNATAEYSDVNVANYMLNVTGYTLNGSATDLANYAFTQPQAFSASITPKPLTLSNLTIQDKVYDGNTNAEISGTAELVGVISPDDVTLNTTTVTAKFLDKKVGNGKDVSVSGLSIKGAQVANYSLTVVGGNLKASITAKPLTIASGVSVDNKEYDGTTKATIKGTPLFTGKISTDVIDAGVGTAVFASKDVAPNNEITVNYTPGGLDGGNYTVTPFKTTASITKAKLTAKAENKVREYAAANPVVSILYTGFKNNETETELDTKPVATIASSATAQANAGTTHTISVAGGTDNNYDFVYEAGLLTISKANQAITFAALPNKEKSAAPFAVTATASSGLPVIISVESGPATLTGNTVTLTGDMGQVVLKAEQAGDTNYNPAEAVTQSFTVTDIVVGVEQPQNEFVSIYPNPVVNNLNIEVFGMSGGQLKLIDISGRVVMEVSLQKGLQEIDMRTLPAGTYTATIITRNSTSSYRLIITK